MMVSGERAQLRGLNLEGLRRHGFSVAEVSFWLKSVLDWFYELGHEFVWKLMLISAIDNHSDRQRTKII